MEAVRTSVDYYVSGQPGSELARQVLWQIHPWSAMQRCKEIYDRSDDIHARRSAIELLRVVADARAVFWIEDFLNDPDEDIQNWGAGIVDQLLFSHLVDPEELSELLAKMAAHPNERVRRMHELIEDFLKSDAELV
ncbi:MAG: hypothetical protein AAFY15_05955 [Cyanobacteria bacterium J06648_11]